MAEVAAHVTDDVLPHVPSEAEPVPEFVCDQSLPHECDH
jgi:hypothetical protein